MTVPGNGESLQLLAALDRLRADFREDLNKHEAAMQRSIDDVRNDVQQFVQDHARVHEVQESSRQQEIAAVKQFIDTARIQKARTDGMLSMMLLVINTLGRNWQVIATVAVFIATVLFGVRIEFTK